MEIRTQEIIDKLLFFVFVVRAASLILENDIVVPSALYLKIPRSPVEEGVTAGDVVFILGLLLGSFLCFLISGGSFRQMFSEIELGRVAYLAFSRFRSFFFNFLQLS